MKEHIHKDLNCLIDGNTGLPIRIYIDKNEVDRDNEISRRAFESGQRLREGLK